MMLFRILFLLPVLLLPCQTAFATPYGVFDVEAIGRGGSGIAFTTSSNVFSNPAMITNVRPIKEFVLVFPSLSFMEMDPDNNQDKIDAFQAAVSASDDTAAKAALAGMTAKTITEQHHFAAGAVLGGVEGNAALHVKNYSYVSAKTNVDNADLSCISPCTYNSTLDIRGIKFIEAGVTFAEKIRFRQIKMLGEVAIGVTPKVVVGTVYEFDDPLTTAEIEQSYSSGQSSGKLSIDLGLAKNYGNIWGVGLVIQNLVPYSFNGPTTEFKVGPHIRAGVARHFAKANISADIDLTNNSSVGFMERSQVLSLGGAYELTDWFKLLGGYSQNFNDSDSGMISLGMGFHWESLRLDLAAQGGSAIKGFGLQLAVEL